MEKEHVSLTNILILISFFISFNTNKIKESRPTINGVSREVKLGKTRSKLREIKSNQRQISTFLNHLR